MRDHYQDLNYYEVRVRGTRQPCEDGQTITLNYHILPGPLAELVIVGHQLDRGLEEELRDSWRRTIFDRFLIQDFESRILRHLVGEDNIGSEVRAEIALSTPERKQLRVTVEAGTAVESRELAFTGNTAFKSGDLNHVIVQAGADVDGWIDRSRIEQAIQRHYRDNGFLDATVQAEAPRVEGRTARLPVAITEGRRYVLDAIMFPGVQADRIVDVAQAANLQHSSPYITDQLEAARRRVQDVYRRWASSLRQLKSSPCRTLRTRPSTSLLSSVAHNAVDATGCASTRRRPGQDPAEFAHLPFERLHGHHRRRLDDGGLQILEFGAGGSSSSPDRRATAST